LRATDTAPMLIVCPNCATSYMIDPASVGAAGRNVRCTRCKTQWFATAAKPHAETSVAAFVDDVIAEAEAGERPLSAAHQRPGERMPRSDEVAQFNAALNDDAGAEPRLPVAGNFEPSLRDHFEHTTPIDDAPSLVPHEQPAPMLDAMPDPLQPLDNEDIESFAARRTRKSPRDPRKKRSRLPSIVLALVALNAAVVIYRAEIVRVLPQTASLFSAIGLPVNLRGMTFEEVAVSKETNDGVPVLVVTGKIVSAANKPVEIPRMRFAVRDTAGQEIYSWTAQPDRSVLGAGETLPFKSRLASPPAEANSVLVRFVNQRDAVTGSK
jgi:predicted Zn finger-like uncharacterized protein